MLSLRFVVCLKHNIGFAKLNDWYNASEETKDGSKQRDEVGPWELSLLTSVHTIHTKADQDEYSGKQSDGS